MQCVSPLALGAAVDGDTAAAAATALGSSANHGYATQFYDKPQDPLGGHA